jgi:drug/metabolite transporter (DMT)-like permease
LSPTALGIALAVTATLCFALLDTLSQHVGRFIPVVMSLWVRYLVQSVLTAVLLWPQYGRQLLITRRPLLQFWRGILMAGSSALAFLSLQHVPVGEFTAILMLTPLVITLMAAVWLRERVTRLAWWLVIGGFAGALVVVRPQGSDFSLGIFLPLLLVVVNAGFQILTSKLVRTEHPAGVHFYSGLCGLLVCSLWLPMAWTEVPNAWLWLSMVMIGVFGSIGHYLLILAYQRAPASRITVYLYSQIGFATLAGWVAFGHTPDQWTLLGVALIAGCGIYGLRKLRH